MAKGYFIVKDPRTGHYYALNGGENSKRPSLLIPVSFSEMGCKTETVEKTSGFAGLAVLITIATA